MMETREAEPTERAEIASILDAAALQTDSLQHALAGGESLVLVAVSVDETGTEGVLLGALILVDNEITTIAVRPGRRGQGIGTTLVEAAAQRRDQLVAEFDPGVRPFWESLGFEITAIPDADRLRGSVE